MAIDKLPVLVNVPGWWICLAVACISIIAWASQLMRTTGTWWFKPFPYLRPSLLILSLSKTPRAALVGVDMPSSHHWPFQKLVRLQKKQNDTSRERNQWNNLFLYISNKINAPHFQYIDTFCWSVNSPLSRNPNTKGLKILVQSSFHSATSLGPSV